MIDFNNEEELKRIDPGNARGSTEMLQKQMEKAWEEVNKINVPYGFRNINKIVFCGMGASIYGALVFRSLIGCEMPVPCEMVSDYLLPEYIDDNTLVVLTSYSGDTEEVLSCAQKAKAKNAKMLALTKGGMLAQFAADNDIPAYIFDASLNPAGAARLGCGYTILGLIGLLNKTRIFEIEENEVTNAIARLKYKFDDLKSTALEDYKLFINKIPIIITAEHLSGNGQILRNQFNETSKSFAAHYLVPDLNHHLMEGLQFPSGSQLFFLVFNTKNFSEKIRKRIELTIDVIKQNNHEAFEFKPSGQTVYDDFMETLIYGSFLSLYLALEYKQDPTINPWVDYFKSKLA